MKILLVTPFLPHRNATHAGGRFVFWLIEELGREHDVFLMTRVSPDEAPHSGDARRICREVRILSHDISTATPGKALRRTASYLALGRLATRWMREERFDLVQVEHVEAGIGIRVPAGIPLVVDCHDVITKPKERIFCSASGGRRIPAWLAFSLTRWVERRVLRKSAMAFVRSEVDREYLAAAVPGVPTRVVPHPCGLDLTGQGRAHDGRTILFLGALHRSLNVDAVLYFAKQVFPAVREKVPDARFIVAGVNPPEALVRLDSHADGIRVVGPVEEVETAYCSATVFAAPILVGGGIIVKILDAMAVGVPVVTTTFGNEGIGAAPGKEILVADDPERFADAVVRLLRDDAENRRIGESGMQFIRGTFGKEFVAGRIDEALHGLVRRRRPPRGRTEQGGDG